MPVSTECAAALLSFRYPSLPFLKRGTEGPEFKGSASVSSVLKVVKDFWKVFQGAASVLGNNQQFCYKICNEKNYIFLG